MKEMRNLLLVMACWLSSGLTAAQEWNGYAGPAVTYDGFLRDREVTQAKPQLSMQPGAGVVLGTGFRTENGFNLFAEGTFSWLNLQFPVPSGSDYSRYQSYFQTRLMAGSGPALHSENEENIFTPFIQIGAAYMTDWGVQLRTNSRQQHFMAVCGAGADWYSKAFIPSSINLSITYTPLNAFKDPVVYEEQGPAGPSELKLQGKLLQATLSCRIYLRFSKKAVNSGYE